MHRAQEFFQEGQIDQDMDGPKEFLYLVFQINDSAIRAWSNAVKACQERSGDSVRSAAVSTSVQPMSDFLICLGMFLLASPESLAKLNWGTPLLQEKELILIPPGDFCAIKRMLDIRL